MTFGEWIENNVHPDMLLAKGERVGQTVHLIEKAGNSTAKIIVEDVPESTAIVRLDIGGLSKVFRSKKERDEERNFDERCDFLMLNETCQKYRAVFVELKSHDPRNIQKGKQQLRWSLPYLKYYLAVFEADCFKENVKKDVEANFFIFSKEPRKRASRSHLASGRYENIFVNIYTRDKFEFSELLDIGTIPSLS